jgi:hypothetical protein
MPIAEVKATLGCGNTLVYSLLGRGDLDAVKIGRRTLVLPVIDFALDL